MSEKVLKLLGSKPTLVTMYEAGVRRVYKDYVKVPRRHWGKFQVLQDELSNADISLLTYTNTVLVFLRTWVKDCHLHSVPYHIFISDFSIEKFMRIHTKKTINMVDVDEFVDTNQELMLLRYYIQKRIDDDTFTLSQAIEDLRPLLSQKCIDLYTRNVNPHMDVVMTLAEEYGSKIVSLDAIIKVANGG